MDTPYGRELLDGALERRFRFEDFNEALAFVNRVGGPAERESHHPTSRSAGTS